MLTIFWQFAEVALVMGFWIAVAFCLAFVGVFVMNLIGDRIYGRQTKERGRGCPRR